MATAGRSNRRTLALDDYVAGVRAGDRAVLARAITLVESTRPEHQAQAQELLQALLPHTGGAVRLGLSGVPGVGKSTFTEALGTRLTAQGHRLAVLAVDPTSARTGGSILGDKTRMAELARDPHAFIRPSPSAGTLGGVARRTRESLLICEAAGYDVVFVETVGVGQSEAVVADMVDCFLLLLLPGAGDDLQGIKRGILELADVLAINKADGDNLTRAQRAQRDYEAALRLLRGGEAWQPPVLLCSALSGEGLDAVWQQVQAHGEQARASGTFAERRQQQLVRWMWSTLEAELLAALQAHPGVAEQVAPIEAEVRAGRLTATLAARRLLAKFGVGEG